MLLYEDLYDFGSVQSAQQMLQDFRIPGPGCASTSVAVVNPPGVNEDFADHVLPRPRGVRYDVGLIRCGSTVTILKLGVKSGFVPDKTWQEVVHAAEMKIASARG